MINLCCSKGSICMPPCYSLYLKRYAKLALGMEKHGDRLHFAYNFKDFPTKQMDGYVQTNIMKPKKRIVYYKTKDDHFYSPVAGVFIDPDNTTARPNLNLNLSSSPPNEGRVGRTIKSLMDYESYEFIQNSKKPYFCISDLIKEITFDLKIIF